MDLYNTWSGDAFLDPELSYHLRNLAIRLPHSPKAQRRSKKWRISWIVLVFLHFPSGPRNLASRLSMCLLNSHILGLKLWRPIAKRFYPNIQQTQIINPKPHNNRTCWRPLQHSGSSFGKLPATYLLWTNKISSNYIYIYVIIHIHFLFSQLWNRWDDIYITCNWSATMALQKDRGFSWNLSWFLRQPLGSSSEAG